jgi:bla regulator protein blaR1
MAAEVLAFLLEGLLATSAAVLLVLAARRGWRRLFGAGSTPLLWAAVPLALLAIALPGPVLIDAAGDAIAVVDAHDATAAAHPVAPMRVPGVDLLLAAWLLGSLASLLHFTVQQRRFRRRLGALRKQGNGIAWAATPTGPAVLGLWRPRIVLPSDFEQRYDPLQQSLIIAHERSHLQRGDLLAVAIATMLRVVYWFNPLIHLAAARLRHDQELASDAEVMRLHPGAFRRYADALLDSRLPRSHPPVGCLWRSGHPLKERIVMLKLPAPSPLRRRAGTLSGTVLLLTVAATTWAAQPASVQRDDGATDMTTLQTKPIDAAGTDVSPREAARRVAERAGLRLGGAELLSDTRTLSFEFNGIPASVALDLIAQESGLTVRIDGDSARFAVAGAGARAGAGTGSDTN